MNNLSTLYLKVTKWTTNKYMIKYLINKIKSSLRNAEAMLVPKAFVDRAIVAEPTLGLLINVEPREPGTMVLNKKVIMKTFGCHCDSEEDSDQIVQREGGEEEQFGAQQPAE